MHPLSNTDSFFKANQSKLWADLYTGLSDTVTIAVLTHRKKVEVFFPRVLLEGLKIWFSITMMLWQAHVKRLLTCYVHLQFQLDRNLKRICKNARTTWKLFEHCATDSKQNWINFNHIWQTKICLVIFFKHNTNLNLHICTIHTDMSLNFRSGDFPHSHILLTLSSANKVTPFEEVHGIISAKIPDKETDHLAYEPILWTKIHGPCGSINPNSPCMIKERCSKHCPKWFLVKQQLRKMVTLYTDIGMIVEF